MSIRGSCTITLPDHSKAFLIGGVDYRTGVDIYDADGYVGAGPSLNHGRRAPGCTSYVYNGETVRIN